MTEKSNFPSSPRSLVAIMIILIFGAVYLFFSSSSAVAPYNPKTPTTTITTTTTQSASPLLEPKCLTYKERYGLCLDIRAKLSSATDKKLFFSQFLRTDSIHPLPKEVALFRLHRIKSWSDDLWLAVCSWVTETTGLPIIPIDEMMATQNDPDRRRELYEIKYPAYNKKIRDTWLFTLGGHEDSIPFEFQDFVKIHLEDELPRIFSPPLYGSGYMHGGDLAAGLFLKVNPQYDFCWIFESDTRFGGTSWHRFLSMARVAGRLNIDHTPTAPNDGRDGIGKDAHLIWFYPRMIHHGYGLPDSMFGKGDEYKKGPTATYRAVERRFWSDAIQQNPVPKDPAQIINSHFLNVKTNYFGSWKTLLENTTFNIAFLPGGGFSRELLIHVLRSSYRLEGHMHQELMLPIMAQLQGLKMTSLVGLKIPNEFLEKSTTKKRSTIDFPFQFYY